MLSSTSRPIIDATLPILLANGPAITRHFYQRMFDHHPELKNLFNLGNQASGEQAQALAGAVYAFAAHLDAPERVSQALDRIAHKHISLGITPAQYTIVGRHLLAAIGEVLGEAVTPAIAAAWDEVYWLMAGELIAREARLYQEREWQVGGSWPWVEVLSKVAASNDTIALTLAAAPGSELPAFLPGQYLSVAVTLPDAGLTQVRQYSLSAAPGTSTLRITVKRVVAGASSPAGTVSNLIHDHVQVGDRLRVGPPAGDFHLRPGTRPAVLISAGVGITPLVSMLNHLARTLHDRPVVFAYATRDAAHFPHRDEVLNLLRQMPQARLHVWFEDEPGLVPNTLPGRMDLAQLDALPRDADHYLCGPLPFMRQQRRWLLDHGVSVADIHYEVFGPDLFGEVQ